jgi:ATP-dependent phosphofructokinase / diphosphate-dependent phosphofructokinase
MADLLGNLLVVQSGGTTATINASLVGAVMEAGRHPDQIEEIYGSLEGLSGALREEMIDLQDEKQHTIDGLKFTPAAALGSSRQPIDFLNLDAAKADLDRLFQVFQTHNIRYLLLMGGRETQDLSLKIHEEAVKRGFEMRVIGIPTAIENDLPHTDSSPGYGSAIKCAATTVLELAHDLRSARDGVVCIIEVVGRATGWIPAGAVLARHNSGDAPHIILLPEVAFDQDAFLKRVKSTFDALRHCVIVVGESLSTANGQPVAGAGRTISEHLAELIQKSLELNTTTVKLGRAQASAAHSASAADAENAIALGAAAIRAAIDGQGGVMMKSIRQTADDGSVKWSTDAHALGEILNAVNSVPRDWLSDDGFLPNDKFVAFAQPLIEGELRAPTERGLPKFAALEKVPVEKKLPPYV